MLVQIEIQPLRYGHSGIYRFEFILPRVMTGTTDEHPIRARVRVSNLNHLDLRRIPDHPKV